MNSKIRLRKTEIRHNFLPLFLTASFPFSLFRARDMLMTSLLYITLLCFY